MSPDDIPKGAAGARGFAGLRDLAAPVSLDSPPPPPMRVDPSKRQETEAPKPSSTQEQGPYQGPPARKIILTARGKLIVGGLIAAAAIWAVADLGSNSGNIPANPAASYTQTPPRYTQVPPEPLVEERPPVGTDMVLSSAQIRYCLSEKIRLEGAHGVLNTYSQTDVDRFNAMIGDYNSRCGSFRYRTGTLETVRAEVQAKKLQLQSEGAARFQK